MRESNHKPALRITLIYTLFSWLWILLSDRLLSIMVNGDLVLMTRLQTYKGWVFVIASAALLYFLLMREILARDRVERAHRQSMEKYRILVEQAGDAIFLIDTNGKFLEVNPSLCTLVGYSRQELLRKNLNDLIPNEERASNLAHLPNLQAGKAVMREQYFSRKDGSRVPVEVSTKILSDGRMQGIARDISERKQAQEELVTWANIFQHTRVGVVVSSRDGRSLEKVNPAFAEMHGYSVEEMVGMPIVDVFAAEWQSHLSENINLAHEKGHHVFESIHLHKDGSEIPVLVDVTAVKDPTGQVQYRIVSVQDITERKQAENDIQRQLRRLASLRAIDNAITSTLDMRVTFEVLLDQVTSQLGVDAVAILLFNPHSHRLDYAGGRGFRTNIIQQTSLRFGESLAGQAAMQRRAIGFKNIYTDDSGFSRSDLVSQEDFQAYYGVPLIAKGEIKGVIEVYHRSPLLHDDQWLSFLEAIAGQAAIAIDNATLYEDLQQSSSELSRAYDATLEGWSRALELRDRETQGHSQRVTDTTLLIAKKAGIREDDLTHVRRGTLLHDIGKMGIPDRILFKEGELTSEEWEVMRKHPVLAYEMLSPISYLRPALDIPYCHHEHWDGSGYPRGLKGEQIPLAARIFSIVDVWDALRSKRPYRDAWPEERVLEYLRAQSNHQFDPAVVEMFLEMDPI